MTQLAHIAADGQADAVHDGRPAVALCGVAVVEPAPATAPVCRTCFEAVLTVLAPVPRWTIEALPGGVLIATKGAPRA